MNRLTPALPLLLLLACGGEGPPDGAMDGGLDGGTQTGTLYIGTATTSGTDPKTLVYAPLQAGAELTLEPGAQGGFHVFMHLQVDDFAIAGMGERPLVQRWARRVDTGELVSRASRTHLFVPSDVPGRVQIDGAVPLFLCPTPVGIEVAEQPLELEVQISADQDSEGVKGKLQFTPRCPEGDQRQFCLNICFG